MKMEFKYLPKIMQDTMAAIKVISNVPEEISLPAILGVMNFATHRLYNVDSKIFGIRPTSLYIVALAPSGAQKTSIYNLLSKGIDRFEEADRIRLDMEYDSYNLELALWKKENAKRFKDISEVDLLNPATMAKLAEEMKEPEPPLGNHYRVPKATVNGLIETLNNQRYCGLFSSEAGEFFNSHSFKDGKASAGGVEMITTLTNLYDGNAIARTTGVDTTRIYNRRFNMLFLLQEGTAKDWLGNQLYSDQGFVHRILLSNCPAWEKKLLALPTKEEIAAAASLEPFYDRTQKLLEKEMNVSEYNKKEILPEEMLLADDAFELLCDYANTITNIAKTDDSYEKWDGFVIRIFEHSLRICATLAAFEELESIDTSIALAAIEIMGFFLEQRLNMEMSATTKNGNTIRVGEDLIKWFKLKKISQVDTHMLNRCTPMYYRGLSKKERYDVIDELHSRGLIDMTKESGKLIITVV